MDPNNSNEMMKQVATFMIKNHCHNLFLGNIDKDGIHEINNKWLKELGLLK